MDKQSKFQSLPASLMYPVVEFASRTFNPPKRLALNLLFRLQFHYGQPLFQEEPFDALDDDPLLIYLGLCLSAPDYIASLLCASASSNLAKEIQVWKETEEIVDGKTRTKAQALAIHGLEMRYRQTMKWSPTSEGNGSIYASAWGTPFFYIEKDGTVNS